ncbi:tyrosyl-DNA phosphodiesterase 2-like [Glandiceps talaboti]
MATAASSECINSDQRRLCEEFAAITGTDVSLGEYYLREKDWQLEAAVNFYFDGSDPAEGGSHGNSYDEGDLDHASMSPSGSGSSRSTSPDLVVTYESGVAVDYALVGNGCESTEVETPGMDPTILTLLTWNIDGLDERNITERTKAVCATIKSHLPDIVYLQEVIPETFAYIETLCSPTYVAIPGNSLGYFTTVLLKKSRIVLLDHSIEPFTSSQMMRNFLTVKARFSTHNLVLMTSHLESTKEHGTERKRQLGKVLKEMSEANPRSTVIFGGDTNLRDKEISDIGGLPGDINDVWQMCGSPPDAQYSWDISKNDNLDWRFKNKPKCRFDRLFMRQSSESPKLHPQNFRFVGTERLASCGRFPSDHWGILCEFKVQ